MEILHKLRFLIYVSAFALVFVFGLYCTFPNDVLRDVAKSTVERAAFSIGPKNRGLPQVEIEEVSLWRLSGLDIDGLRVIWPQKNELEGIAFAIDRLKARMGFLSLLTGSKELAMEAKLYGGSLASRVAMSEKKILTSFYIDASAIDLKAMSFIETALGSPLEGVIEIESDISANSRMSEDGAGFFKMQIDGMAFGPGSLRMPMGGFVSAVSVPKTALGKLVVDFLVEQGQFKAQEFSLSGGDIEGELDLNIITGQSARTTRLEGDGWFTVKPELVSQNETLKTMFDLIPQLRAAKGGKRVGLMIRGSVARPMVRLNRYVAKSPEDAKASKAKTAKALSGAGG